MGVPFRIATKEERAWYERTLYPLQDRVLAIAGEYEELALAGGTALARAYLHHRYSEDLDLFTQADRVDTYAAAVLGRLERAGLGIEVQRRGTTHVRAAVVDGATRLQVDFANDFRLVLPAYQSAALKARVYSLRDLASNKISAFEDRAEAKDVVDLYFVCEHLGWSQIFEDAETKRVPPAYDALQNILAQPITGSALLVREVNESEYERFLEGVRTALTAEVKKKASAARRRIRAIVRDVLWDTPAESRTINARTLPILRRRLSQLALPERIALGERLASFEAHFAS
ncbi:MAG: nucleotidyl transferase AbiEii/AbiGii toxin family protein [Vulcanimicrobiaceae bacterium]